MNEGTPEKMIPERDHIREVNDWKKFTKTWQLIAIAMLVSGLMTGFLLGGLIFSGEEPEDDVYQTIEIWMCEDENGDTWYCINPELSGGTYINIEWVNFTDTNNGTALLNLKNEHTEWISMYNCWLVAELDVRIND